VGDEQHGQREFLSQFGKQLQYLSLDSDIERGRWLVGNQERRAIHHRHSNHDALPLASGELVGIASRTPVGVLDSHRAQGFNGATPGIGLCDPASTIPGMRQYRLGDLIAHPHNRIERRHGLLEDHADAGAANVPHLLNR